MIAAAYALAVILVAFPALASAECAWVLWSATTHPDGSSSGFSPAPDAAVPTYAACVSAAKSSAETARAALATVDAAAVTSEVVGGGYQVTNGRPLADKTYWSMVFQCFPDTVDPRGPKGGGR